jgi:hypothetical protein
MKQGLCETDSLLHSLGECADAMFAPGRHSNKFEHGLNSFQTIGPSHARERPVEVQGLLGCHERGESVMLRQIADSAQGFLVSDGHAEHGARDT